MCGVSQCVGKSVTKTSAINVYQLPCGLDPAKNKQLLQLQLYANTKLGTRVRSRGIKLRNFTYSVFRERKKVKMRQHNKSQRLHNINVTTNVALTKN